MPDEPSSSLAVRDPELARVATLGKWLALSESGRDTEQASGASAALRLYYAQELQLPPLAATELSVIKGRLVISAKLLRALAARHGYRVLRDPGSNDQTCTAILTDSSGEVGRATFTIEDAKRAGLIRDRSAWQTHPARMLWARASKFVLDDFAPEVTLGLHTTEELEEIQGGKYDLYRAWKADQARADDEIEFEVDEDPTGDGEPNTTAGGLKIPAVATTPSP